MSVGKLLDYSQARPPLGQVKAHGYSCVYRYVCSDASETGLRGKRLTPTERDQILADGLDIGVHGEDEAGAAQKGYPRGKQQGQQWADYAHSVLGAPKGMTIVAAIDYDTAGTYPSVVADYLHGVTDGLQGEYATGVYGSIYVVDASLAAKHAVHGVQTNAWSQGKVSSWAHVYQHGPSEFPGTDYNDILRVPHGTWLQTLNGDDMSAADVQAITDHFDQRLDLLWKALGGEDNSVFAGGITVKDSEAYTKTLLQYLWQALGGTDNSVFAGGTNLGDLEAKLAEQRAQMVADLTTELQNAGITIAQPVVEAAFKNVLAKLAQ